jgi:adenine phosphoribosyltransferase
MQPIEALIRDVADFPRPGVLFKDITPLLADAKAFALCIDALAEPWRDARVDIVCGIESRGFIFGAALAHALGAGFAPLRKAGKLPPPTVGVDYGLEYGSDRIEIGAEALHAAHRVLIVDDVLATGGTLDAARRLLAMSGAHVVGGAVVIELAALGGRARWQGESPLQALLTY